MQGSYKSTRQTQSQSQSSNKRSKHRCLDTTIPTIIIDAIKEYSKPPEANRVCYRMAIMYHYVEILDAPNAIHWKGKGRTISLIRRALHMHASQRRVILRTLEEIMRCAVEGIEFNGKIESKHKLGRKIIILPGSAEELLIANWMEAHCGFRQTTYMVKEYRRQQGDTRVSVYAVMSAFYRLQPKVDILQKIQSGGENEKWITARYNVSKQMEAMLGNLTQEEMLTNQAGKNCTNERCEFHLSLVKSLSIETTSNNNPPHINNSCTLPYRYHDTRSAASHV